MDLRLLDPLATPVVADAVGGAPWFSVVGRLCVGLALVAVLLAPVRAAEPNTSPAPRNGTGTLLIVGGGKLPDAIRRHFIDLAGGKNARLVIIPTASNKADQPELLQTYQLFKSLDVKSVKVLHTRDRKKADDPAFLRPLTEATGVWLTGGDQSLLSATYHGTAVEKELVRVITRGGVVAGTSAGAAVMSERMITGGTQDAEVGTGFGLLVGVVIDQHFWNRNRLHRLLGVLARYPECPGVGIDEETALVVHGLTATVEGNGNVRACLSAQGKLPPMVQVLKDGEKLDLAALIKTASTRITPPAVVSPGKPAPESKSPAPTGRAVLSAMP